MSEELQDEVEAINSIYGEGTLAPAGDSDPAVYILRLPPLGDEASAAEDDSDAVARPSLRLQFPAAYPEEPPSVLGTHSSGGGNARRGAAARDLELLREALGQAYQPGAVCLFDTLEELARLREGEEEATPAAAEASQREEGGVDHEGEGQRPRRPGDLQQDTILSDPPPWVISDPITEMKSTFVARCAQVTSPRQAESYVAHLLATDKRVRGATHNMTAWRIRGADGVTSFQDCDDDGEQAAGGRLLHLMQLMDLWDVMVVVTRWYGGQKLGPRRFAVINQAARDVFVRAGLVPEPGSGTKKKGHGK